MLGVTPSLTPPQTFASRDLVKEQTLIDRIGASKDAKPKHRVVIRTTGAGFGGMIGQAVASISARIQR